MVDSLPEPAEIGPAMIEIVRRAPAGSRTANLAGLGEKPYRSPRGGATGLRDLEVRATRLARARSSSIDS